MQLNNLKNKFLPLLALTGVFFAACSELSSDSPNGGERSISGYSQKGPFVKGSKVSLYEMDESLKQTGAYYYTTVDNDMGEYHLENIPLTGRYAWMQVDGYYLSELTGLRSDTRIVLNSLVDLKNRKSVNINLLGHLAFEREKYLVRNGMPIEDAKRLAESEVLRAFSLDEESVPFDQMDVFGGTDADAKLLAISILVLQRTDKDDESNVMERMTEFAYDMEEDGIWSDLSLKEYLAALVSVSNYDSASRTFFELYQGKTVPHYEKYLDQFAKSVPFYGACEEENTIKMDVVCTMVDTIRLSHVSSMIPEYEKQWECDESERPFICKDSIWVKYGGFLHYAGASSENEVVYGEMTDSRDGRKYKTVVLGGADGKKVTWMADDLSYGFKNGEVDPYNHVPMYVWGEASEVNRSAQGACPEGWHIPSVNEWTNVASDVDDLGRAATNMDKLGRSCLAMDHFSYRDTKSCFQFWLDDSLATNAVMVGYRSQYLSGRVRFDYATNLLPTTFDAEITDKAAIRCIKDE